MLELTGELALVDEHLDWLFSVPAPDTGLWVLTKGDQCTSIVEEADGAHRKVTVTRKNLSTNKVTSHKKLSGCALSPTDSLALLRAAFDKFD